MREEEEEEEEEVFDRKYKCINILRYAGCLSSIEREKEEEEGEERSDLSEKRGVIERG